MAATEGLVPGHHLRTYDGERAECECGVEIHWKGNPEEHVWHLIDVAFEDGITLLRKNLAGALVETGRYVTRYQRNCAHADVDCHGTCYDCGVDHVDPENPTSMVVPVPGDRVLMTDGSTARVAARREVDSGVVLQVQRTGLDYAEWVGVEEISGIEDAYDVRQIARVIHADDLAHGWAALAWEDMDQDSRDWYESNARAVRAHLLGED